MLNLQAILCSLILHTLWQFLVKKKFYFWQKNRFKSLKRCSTTIPILAQRMLEGRGTSEKWQSSSSISS